MVERWVGAPEDILGLHTPAASVCGLQEGTSLPTGVTVSPRTQEVSPGATQA